MPLHSAGPRRQLMLYHHFDRDGALDAHVRYQLQAYRNFGIEIVLLSNSPIDSEGMSFLEKLGCEVVLRDNEGFDFGAWREYLTAHDSELSNRCERLIFANSSCYGPLFPLDELFGEMERRDCDFWGLTSCSRQKKYPPHLQSYFLVFKPRVFTSKPFAEYWRAGHRYGAFKEAVWQGEIALSQALTQAGFRYAAYADLDDTRYHANINFVESFSFTVPDFLVARKRLPLVKIKGFVSAPDKPFCRSGVILRAIRESGSNYPTQLIVDHLRRTQPLSWQKNLPESMIVPDADAATPPDPGLRFAVIAHYFYADLFDEAIAYLANIPYDFDLLVSTGSEEHAALLRAKIEQAKFARLRHAEVRVAPNRGRDVAPWLFTFSDLQNRYDVILKIHTKKSLHTPEILGFEWGRHIMKSLLPSPSGVGAVLKAFADEPRLGTVFATYPPIVHLEAPLGYKGDEPQLVEEWLKRCCGNNMPPRETNQPVFAAGTMFYYRPEALRKLFECGVKLEEFPLEPLPAVGTIAHALERAVPYIMQSAGYYYRNVLPIPVLAESFRIYEDRLMSAMWDAKDARIEELEEKYNGLLQSRIWRLTAPLRALLDRFKRPFRTPTP